MCVFKERIGEKEIEENRSFGQGSKRRHRRSVVPPLEAATTISLLSIVRNPAVVQGGRKRRWAGVTRFNLGDRTTST